MTGSLVEGSRKADHLIGIGAFSQLPVGQRRLAPCQRARLVDHDRADGREHFERPAAFDKNAALGGAGDAGDDRNRHREDERAGGGDDHDRQPAYRVAGGEPRGPGYRQGREQEPDGEAIRQAHHRRLRPFGRFDHADDAGIGAFGRGMRGDKVERGADIGAAAQDWSVASPLDRHRFPGQGQFVENGDAFADHAVDRRDFALADKDAVAGAELFDRHLDQAAVEIAHRALGHALEQRRHLAARAPDGDALEELAAGIHQGNDDAGKLLAEKQRAGHREQRHDIEADLGPPEAGDDLDRETDNHHRGSGAPDQRCEARPGRRICGKSQRQRDSRHGNKSAAKEIESCFRLHAQSRGPAGAARIDPCQSGHRQ